jgi:hypothetical protein
MIFSPYDINSAGIMQMPESNLNIKKPIRHLLKVICGLDTRIILKFIPQITKYCVPKI